VSLYNFIQQSFFEIIKVLFYQFRFLILNYNVVLLNGTNIAIFIEYFLKKRTRIKPKGIYTKLQKRKYQYRVKRPRGIMRSLSTFVPLTPALLLYKIKPLTNAFLVNNTSANTSVIKINEFKPKSLVYSLRLSTEISLEKNFWFILNKKINQKIKINNKHNFSKIKIRRQFKQLNKKILSKKFILRYLLLSTWLLNKYFNFIVKFNLIYFLDKLFFKLPVLNFFISLKNLDHFFTTNKKLQKNLVVITRKTLPLFFYRKNFFYFSLIMTYALINHSLLLILEHVEKFMRRVLGKRYFINHILNLLEYYNKKKFIVSFCFLLRGTIEKHGRTLTFFLIRGKLSLQTFSNIIYYDYIQCYQRYGVFGIHFWLRFRNLLK